MHNGNPSEDAKKRGRMGSKREKVIRLISFSFLSGVEITFKIVGK